MTTATKAPKASKTTLVASTPVMASIPNLHQHIPIVQDGCNIIQIGLGGTGGPVAMNVLRVIGGLEKDYQARMRYIGIDGDHFEEKNLGRQLCITPDLGKNKAQVIVGRYSNAFKVSTNSASYLDEYIKSPEDIMKYMHVGYTNIIIDNLDKNVPRTWIDQAVRQFVKKYKIAYVYVISTGNGEWNGQVSIGCMHKTSSTMVVPEMGKTAMDEPYYFSIPSPYEICPELLDVTVDAREEALSCADRAVANVQSLVANNTAATICFNFVNAIMSQFIHQATGKEDIVLTIGTVRFNAKNNGYKCEQLTDEYLAKGVF